MAKFAYIHIPYCKSKCKYCVFTSFKYLDDKYLSNLLNEIKTYYKGEKLKTLYIGGGTPSLLESKDINSLVKCFNFDESPEITIEINPDDAKENFLKSLFEIGINRLSIGAQTFDDNVLKLIGRRHNSKDTIYAVERAKKIGFTNINLDLIYGLPRSSIKKDLEEIIKLDVPHISTYGLKIEPNSYFYSHCPKNLPDDDSQADMYIEINDTLKNFGYKRYEISNFAFEGMESKHNLNYWNNEEYYGFGIAAHGYINGIRYSNSITYENYYRNFRAENHSVLPSEKIEEEIFLGFRKESGIHTSTFKEKFGIDFETKYSKVLEKYVPEYIEKTPLGYKLTLRGVLLSNIILSDFLS